jgi:hypothetical protein
MNRRRVTSLVRLAVALQATVATWICAPPLASRTQEVLSGAKAGDAAVGDAVVGTVGVNYDDRGEERKKGRKNTSVYFTPPQLPTLSEGASPKAALFVNKRLDGHELRVDTTSPSLRFELLLSRELTDFYLPAGTLEVVGVSKQSIRYRVPEIKIFAFKPLPLELAPPEVLGEKVRLRAEGDVPSGVSKLEVCHEHGAYLRGGKEPVNQVVVSDEAQIAGGRVKLTIELAAPIPQRTQVVLELCDARRKDRWVYRGELPRDATKRSDKNPPNPPTPPKPLEPPNPPREISVRMVRVEESAGPRLIFWIDNPPNELSDGFKAEIFNAIPDKMSFTGSLDFTRTAEGRLRAEVGGGGGLQSLSLKIGSSEYVANGIRPFVVIPHKEPKPGKGSVLVWAIVSLAVGLVLGFLCAPLLRVQKKHTGKASAAAPAQVARAEPGSGSPPQTQPLPRAEEPGERDPIPVRPVPVHETGPVPVRTRSSTPADEANLLRLVNQWWAEDPSRSRNRLLALARQYGFADLELYESTRLEENLSRLTDRRFSFRRNDKALEWIFSRSGTEVLALPLDERFFEAGQALRLVARLFDGVDSQARSARFERADKACSLETEDGEFYRLKQRGRVQLAGVRSPSDLGGPAGTTHVAEPIPPIAPRQVEEIIHRVEDLGGQNQNLERHITDVGNRLTSIQHELLTRSAFNNGLEEVTKRIEEVLTQLWSTQVKLHSGSVSVGEGGDRIEAFGGTSRLRPREPELAVRAREPEVDAVPELARAERSGPSESFERELVGSLPPLPLAIPHASPNLGPQEYLRALDYAAGTFGSSDWKVTIVHFVIRSEGSRDLVELHHPREILTGSVACTCGHLTEELLYQLAIGIEKDAGQFVAILVPSGCRMDVYGKGYAVLLNRRLPDGLGRTAQAKKVAILQKTRETGHEFYDVIKPMEVISE